MKKVFSVLFSSKTSLILLLLFAVSIAIATFVEDRYDTTTAQLIIYKAWWFELIIGLMALNFIGQLKRHHFFSISKAGGFLFHIGFIVLIIGAAVTRYFGFEGNMHIREGENSNVITSIEPYLQFNVSGTNGNFSDEHRLLLKSVGSNNFSYHVNSGSPEPVKVSFNQYIKNAEEVINENMPGGVDMLALQISSGGTGQGFYLKKGEHIYSGGISVSFADTTLDHDIIISEDNGRLFAKSKTALYGMDMSGGKPDTTQSGTMIEFREKNLFQYNDVLFTLIRFYKQAELGFRKLKDENEGIDVLTVNVDFKDHHHQVNLFGASDPEQKGQQVTFGDLKIDIKYCPKKIELPFSIKLNDFILDRYAGSMSPSSFASEVTLIDSIKSNAFNKRIFMNHVLDYKGYRFFQSSYDTDEKGTVLSVNHDFWGTWISYLSYFLLLLGFIISLFNKTSRFRFLTIAIKSIRQSRKTVLFFVLFFLAGHYIQAQEHSENHIVSKNEAEKFGKILVQTFDGRLEPVHTMAYEAMHKISKKDKFDFAGKESMDAIQVMIDMIADPEYWKQQKMIYVRDKSVGNIVGISGKYASFNDFIESNGQYKLAEIAEKSFRKKQAEQNQFDKEIIKVDERVNLFFMLLQGSLLKIFPEDQTSKNWIAWNDSIAMKPITGILALLNNDMQLKEFNYGNILSAYFQELISGTHSGNFSKPDKILGYIKNIQQSNIDSKYFPSAKKINAEISFNKLNLFNKLSYYYAFLSLILIIVAFADNIKSRTKKIKWLSWLQHICVALLIAAFALHTYGMIIRWYLSGHAPWSNGYEALLLIAWSAVLSGFLFMKNTKIIQAATAFLASMILMTAGHSNYDPQLTNLQPVLKSYWLIIHVAVITISYGFLALGFILGIINMFLYLFKSSKNVSRSNLLINELTFINEKNLQIGLFLATMGTFLGGVWASESWGRYWGWDAKETWALIIIIVYSVILHLRLVPNLRNSYIFNISSIIGFGSVLMTFMGVNYYFSKGLHSYASDEKTIFPLWGWITILSIILLMIAAGIKEKRSNKNRLSDINGY